MTTLEFPSSGITTRSISPAATDSISSVSCASGLPAVPQQRSNSLRPTSPAPVTLLQEQAKVAQQQSLQGGQAVPVEETDLAPQNEEEVSNSVAKTRLFPSNVGRTDRRTYRRTDVPTDARARRLVEQTVAMIRGEREKRMNEIKGSRQPHRNAARGYSCTFSSCDASHTRSTRSRTQIWRDGRCE